MSKKKIYIAGPMRGCPEHNFPAFHRAEEYLKSLGWAVINPARLDEQFGFDPSKDKAPVDQKGLAIRDIILLSECDAIGLLDGYKNSFGAMAEFKFAEWIGLEVYSLGAGCVMPRGDVGVIPNIKYFVICGLPQHGKSTAAKYISSRLQWEYGETSDVVSESLWERVGYPDSKVKKENIRHLLVAEGNHITEDDKGYLVRKLINNGAKIISGVRRKEEFDTLPPYEAGCFRIWVDRPNFKRIEDNTTVTAEDCDVIVKNHSTVEKFLDQIEELLVRLDLVEA